MSYRSLTTPTMVTITAAWIDPAGERPVIEALPQAGALLPSLDKAHKGLLNTQAGGAKAAAELQQVQQKQAVVDQKHDRKARGTFNALTAFADLADDPDEAASYLALRDKLFPKGLDVVRWSYTDEAGEAKLAEKRLDKDDKDLLAKLPTPKGTLLDAHHARIKAGKELGEMEKDRALLETKQPDAPTAADALKARNLWIRTVNAFVAALALEDGLDDGAREKILGPLERAEAKADRRQASAADAPAPVAPAAPAPAAPAPAPAAPAAEKKDG